jgi:hypothetical protein
VDESNPARDRLDLDELVSRIERNQVETRRFAAEQSKLATEASLLAAEQLRIARKVALGPKLTIAIWTALVLSVALLGSQLVLWNTMGSLNTQLSVMQAQLSQIALIVAKR